MLRLGVISVAMTVAAYVLSGWRGVVFYLTVCLLTKVSLEALNYVEHYGIVRVPTEPVQPRHSWNCNHLISSIFTYNLTRHSHHHADAHVPFQDLRAFEDQPKMPGGFMTAYLTAWVPPLWRKRITPKLRETNERSPRKRTNAAAGRPSMRSPVLQSSVEPQTGRAASFHGADRHPTELTGNGWPCFWRWPGHKLRFKGSRAPCE